MKQQKKQVIAARAGLIPESDWHVEEDRYVVDEDNVLIADCYADSALDFGLPSVHDVKANARLIAQASKLSCALRFDKSDLATILAALRFFQEQYDNRSARVIREDWPDHFVGIKPLGTDDISTLCERLNCADIVVLPKHK